MTYGSIDDDYAFRTALLDEASHRHASEFAAALTSLHLVRAGLPMDQPLLDAAIRRLEGGARLERFLLDPGDDDLAMVLLDLCGLISTTRATRPRFKVRVLRPAVMREPREMRLFLLVAHKLLANAARWCDREHREIAVRLATRRGELRVTVVNHVRDEIEGEGRGVGGLDALRRLIAPVGGSISCRMEDTRFVAQARFPVIEATPSAARRLG